MDIGNIVSFGRYKWKVIDIKNNHILLITEQIIEQRDYHNKKEPITWENSEIRHYLNNEFFERFSISDQKKIISTKNKIKALVIGATKLVVPK